MDHCDVLCNVKKEKIPIESIFIESIEVNIVLGQDSENVGLFVLTMHHININSF